MSTLKGTLPIGCQQSAYYHTHAGKGTALVGFGQRAQGARQIQNKSIAYAVPSADAAMLTDEGQKHVKSELWISSHVLLHIVAGSVMLPFILNVLQFVVILLDKRSRNEVKDTLGAFSCTPGKIEMSISL